MTCLTHHRILALLACLILVAFGLRALSIDTQSMWRDEIDTLCFALDFWSVLEQALGQAPDDGLQEGVALGKRAHCHPTPGLDRVEAAEGIWPTLRALFTLRGWNGPFYTLAMRPWIGLTGYSPFAVRYSSLLLGLLAVPLTFVLGRRLLGKAAGLTGATLVAASPHLVWYSQEAKMYAAILSLGLLAIYGLRRALNGSSARLGGLASLKWWGVAVGATTLALYSHILTALLIPLHVALGLIWWPHTRRRWRRALAALALLTLPYLPLLVWQARNWLMAPGQATLFTWTRLDMILGETLDGWGANFIADPWATLVLGGLAALALLGITASWWKNQEGPVGDPRPTKQARNTWREPLGLLVWMLLPVLGIWLISVRQPIFTNRYLVWAAPALYLLAAAGFVGLVRLGRRSALVAGGLLLVVLIGDGRALLYQATEPIKPDFRAAAAYLDEHYWSGDLIIFHLSYIEDNFDYYFDREYTGWGAPAPAGGLTDADVDRYMQTHTRGHERVWLVLSESQMWDPNGQVKAWMDGHAVGPPEEGRFAHASVFRYQLASNGE